MFLLVIIIFLNMLALPLDYLLSLLCHSVQLHIFRPLLKISDFQGQSLVLVLHMLQLRLRLIDVDHLLYFLVTSLFDLAVLIDDHLLVNEDCIFVVSRDGVLGHFYLSLLQVNDDFKVVLHFF